MEHKDLCGYVHKLLLAWFFDSAPPQVGMELRLLLSQPANRWNFSPSPPRPPPWDLST